MTIPLSRTQIARLGEELRLGVIEPDSDWWPIYVSYLNRCEFIREEIQQRVEDCLAGQNLSISGRTKTRDTLRDKLIKNPEYKLGNIDDVIGIRIVGDFSLKEQDQICSQLKEKFALPHKMKDRRKNPIAGYRALHLIVRAEEIHAEIQIRTKLQAQWADLFERSADTWGRQIRYGNPPNFESEEMLLNRQGIIDRMVDLSLSSIAEAERGENVKRVLQQVIDQIDLRTVASVIPISRDLKKLSKIERDRMVKEKKALKSIKEDRPHVEELKDFIAEGVDSLKAEIDEILFEIKNQVT